MKWCLVLALAATLMGCVKESKPVLEVGQFQFSAEDLVRRKKVLQFYFPNQTNIDAGRDLVKIYSQVQVALDLGFSDLRGRVIAEDKRIDEATLDPEGLARIKRIFDNDVEAYRRLYVVPGFASRILTEIALRDREAQAASREKVERFLKVAEKTPARFADIAKEQGLRRRGVTVSEEKGVHFESSNKGEEEREVAGDEVSPILNARWKEGQLKDAQSEAQRWVREIAVSLKPGAVSSRLVDRGDAWLAIKLLGTDKKTGEIRFDCVEVPKDDVGKWIEARTGKVKIVGG